MRVKSRPLFFIKASSVETSWLKRCWLRLMEADVLTFQQKPNVPHHLHSGAALQVFSSFPGHFLAQFDLVLALQSPALSAQNSRRLPRVQNGHEWLHLEGNALARSQAETGKAPWFVPIFSKGMLWTMDHGWPWMVPWYSSMQSVACCEY